MPFPLPLPLDENPLPLPLPQFALPLKLPPLPLPLKLPALPLPLKLPALPLPLKFPVLPLPLKLPTPFAATTMLWSSAVPDLPAVVMPGTSGGDLGLILADRYPSLPVLYTSGFADNDVVRRGLLDAGRPFLQKPFAPRELARKVREVLEQSLVASR